MVTLVRPVTPDITTNNWTSTPLFSKINAAFPDDGTFVQSENDPSNDIFEVPLATQSDPADSTGHIVRIRMQKADSGGGQPGTVNVIWRLYQGTTQIATQTESAVSAGFTTYALALSGAEADNITDYTDLRVRVDADKSAGARTTWCEVSGIEFETPSGSFTPETTDWRWGEDHAADPSIWLAAENTKPVLRAEDNYVNLRARVLIEENGGVADTDGAITFEITADGGTTWWAATEGSGEIHMHVADGQGTHGNTIGVQRLTNANTSGEFFENQTGTQSIAASETGLEIDICFYIRTVIPDQTYRIRILWDGVAVPTKGGSSDIEIQGSTEAVRPNTVVRLDLVSSSGEPQTLNFGHNTNSFYDGTNWWMFYNQENASQATVMRYKSWSGTGGWSSESTISFTDINSPRRHKLVFREIGGTKYVFLMVASSGTQWYLKRGSISGTTITWDSTERSITIMPSGSDSSSAPVLDIDDGDFLWIGGKADGVTTDIWAAQSVNIGSHATYYTFNTAKQLTDANAEGSNDAHRIIALASGEALMVYHHLGDLDIRACKVTQSGGFGTAVKVSASADAGGPLGSDWGVARGGGDVYMGYNEGTASTGAWAMQVYSETGDSWAAATNPSVTNVGTSNDGQVVAYGDDGKVYMFSTFVDDGGNDTIIQYKAYTGGTSGTWDGSLSTMAGAVADHGNMDNIGIIAYPNGGGKILVFAERGDDPHIGTEWVLEFFVLNASGGTTYDESNRTFTINATPILVDVQTWIDALAFTVNESDAVADLQTWVDILAFVINATPTVLDVQSYVHALGFTINATPTVLDVQSYVHTLAFTINGTVVVTDTLTFKELDLLISLTATPTVLDLQNYNPEALVFTINETTTLADVQSYVDTLAFTINSTPTVLDVQTWIDALSFTINESTTVVDVQTWVDLLSFTINSTVAVSDILTFKEIDLLISLTATPTVLDVQTWVDVLPFVINATPIVTDFMTHNPEPLGFVINATPTVVDVQTWVDTLNFVVNATVVVTDVQTWVDTLTFVINATSVVTDVQFYADALAFTINATPTIIDVQSYVETLNFTINGTTVTSDVQAYVDALTFTIISFVTVLDVVIGGDEFLSFTINAIVTMLDIYFPIAPTSNPIIHRGMQERHNDTVSVDDDQRSRGRHVGTVV